MADRFQDILQKHPTLLSHQQSGFIRGGGCDLPLRFLFDRIQDHNKNHLMVFLLFIDASKVFYRVQFWHIEATLRRFAFPEHVINFLMDYYRFAKSSFKTAWGKTKCLDLGNGVSQGCPFSPIMYILCMDDYHTRMADLNIDGRIGIKWDLDYQHFETTIGLADDCAGMSGGPKSVIRFWGFQRNFMSVMDGS